MGKTRLTINETSLSVKELFISFIDERQQLGRSKVTLATYQESMKDFYDVFGSDIKVSDIGKSTVLLYQKALNSRGVSVSTVNHHLRTFRAFVRWAYQNDYIKSEIHVSLVKGQETMKDPYTEDELMRLLEKPTVKDGYVAWRTWAMINWILGTGNRLGTITNLRISDLDFHNAQVILRFQKNKKVSTVPMDSTLIRVMKEYIRKCRSDADDNDYLFTDIYGDKLTNTAIRTSLNKYNKARGVTKTSAHLLRHTFAKLYIMNGGDLVRLQRLLGHSTLEMSKHYVNLYGPDLSIGYENTSPLRNLMANSQEPKRSVIKVKRR